MTKPSEDGFTLVEILVSILLFSIVSLGFYQVMFTSVEGGDTANSVARVSEEARHGFNRLVRDTREAKEILEATPTAYTVWVDFDGDDDIDSDDYEYIRFAFVGDEITLTAMQPGGDQESIADDTVLEGPRTLVLGVQDIEGADIFQYSSNRLEFDADADGEASFAELETALGTDAALDYVSSVDYVFAIETADGEQATNFFSQAQLRNKRFAD